ncbi:uncharacterized protein LOC117505952 isoform X2 [Thalassophryne amazonica]|uniref:uncharacterized protein LOC117505952 isoform X2 n=1 Tax=Thalassophryne amazonica TaxID=390379 RepID=UPI0014723B09|nr:uncharacterized protein LOC117505952 isoform X2 [Thalassophryne amazonica]
MEEDVLQFLESRQIPKEDIIRMQRDKIDKAVLTIMTDEQMAKYLPSYGDRVATLSFCCQRNSSTNTDKDILLQRLKEKIGTRKMKSKTKRALTDTRNAPQTKKDMTRSGNTSAEKTTRKIEVGWLHFSSNQYHQVRTRNGGGTRHTTVEKTTVAQILEMAKGLFFPNGNSTKGPVEDFTFTICDFKRNQIPMEDTVGNIYEQTKLRLLRFYLCSKEAEVDEDGGFSSEVFSEEEALQATVHDVSDPTGDVLELRSSSDSDNEEQAVDFPVLHPISRKQRTSETVASQSPERLHHLCSTPTHTSHSSKQLQPNKGCSEGFEVLGMDETVEWDPEDHTSRESDDNVVVITLNCDQEYEAQSSQHSELLLKGLHFQLSDDLYTVQKQSAEESVQNVQMHFSWRLNMQPRTIFNMEEESLVSEPQNECQENAHPKEERNQRFSTFTKKMSQLRVFLQTGKYSSDTDKKDHRNIRNQSKKHVWDEDSKYISFCLLLVEWYNT